MSQSRACAKVGSGLEVSLDKVCVCVCPHAGVALWTGLPCTMPLSHRKWQEASQKIQELQASQEERSDHEQKIKVGAPCQSAQLPVLGREGSPPVTPTPACTACSVACEDACWLSCGCWAPWEATMSIQVLKCTSDEDPLEIHGKRITQRTAV